MTTPPFNADEWRNIFRAYRDDPHQQTAIEILRQHLEEDIRVDPTIMTKESCWYKHFRKTPTAYL
jgi:hypothetical protein